MARTLIVIDDNQDAVETLRGLIRKWGLDYSIVSNQDFLRPINNSDESRDAFCFKIIELINQHKNENIEAILLDVLFEIGDEDNKVEEALGYVLGKRIRQNYPHIPIILFTIRGEKQDIKDASYFLNFDGYITKNDFRKSRNADFFVVELSKARKKRDSILEEFQEYTKHNHPELQCADCLRVQEIKNRRLSTPRPKPRVFIGSSVEGVGIAQKTQNLLQYDIESEIWNQGTIFGLGDSTIEALERAVLVYDFAIFVFTPDDEIHVRNQVKPVARDNVVFELGLFIGKLSRKRAFVIHPSKNTISLPSDLAGVTTAKYDPDSQNLVAALGPACETIRTAITKDWNSA